MKLRLSSLAALAAALILASTALAAGFGGQVSIEVHKAQGTVKGALTSANAKCVPNRKVHLLYNDGSGFQAVFKVKTNAAGGYGFKHPPPVPSGKYKVAVAKKQLAAGMCRRVVSDTVKVS